MEYEKALQIVKDYQYLIGNEISQKSTFIKMMVDYISIHPITGVNIVDKDWLTPLNLKNKSDLANKNCIVYFILDYHRQNGQGIFITTNELIKDYLLPSST
ncbi:hypothetical protein [Mucilaginibacter sp. FT3.2]|uniref:hypothetical protein n=1 Tax=Mucilaginibacter sp. FT3.2 TaxID=2723090 RepID=UPI00160B0BA6|nr:hypothetical protein [Mucilaginibacter sp. FT3.2]MBB6234189.1 hypothetical protein [Mucilaginibacter sp. FT3.2]